ncbi:GTP pyrophosphokinase [Bacillus sp. es.036]|uniref:GTP pyrophosphokinase n=1 Tax=Bacillus sp. es.036 TaxID=1761764 RepID=UPI000BF9ABA3|nr:hypothetical protein [Bacillus sp. es.036]PFG13059.1 ppGpp synthetase/RelA/SpoT-type nucleotidyltransferase [Bacillus sp. es.036]
MSKVLDSIQLEYETEKDKYESFCRVITEQLNELLRNFHLPLPIESRVKEWKSIKDKIERNKLRINRVEEINDLAGIRIIVLFRRDLELVSKIIEENFVVFRKENTEERLTENQFGYGSYHFEISANDSWSLIPTLSKYQNCKAEIQLRTVSQHNWAATSHVLQYKNEHDVPLPLRRSINRIAALLETVDLEYERLLTEREIYNNNLDEPTDELNVELVRKLLMRTFPDNEIEDEPYSVILDTLKNFNINTIKDLNQLIQNNKEMVLTDESAQLENSKRDVRLGLSPSGTTIERLENGVYYSYLGLVRVLLRCEIGDEKINDYLKRTNA